MTTLTKRDSTGLLLAAMLTACGMKFVDDVETDELNGSSETGAGDTGTGGTSEDPSASGNAGDEGGDPVGCEPDASAVCGPDATPQLVSLSPRPPVDPVHSEYDCTVTSLGYGNDIANIVFDCGLESPVEWNSLLPAETYAKLSVDQAVHLEYTPSTTGVGSAAVVSVDGHPLIIVLDGGGVDPDPTIAELGPFSVAIQDDVCLPPCVASDQVCYSYDRQQLVFTANGVDTAVWDQGSANVTVDGIDYRISVAVAMGFEVVHPDADACGDPGVAVYSFHIVDVTP